MLFAICDTQPADARRLSDLLESYLEQRDLHCRVEQFSRPELLLEFCRSYPCTAVFLQVSAAGCPNLEIAGRLWALSPETPVILTSDSLDCAPDGYRVRAFAYLLKTRLPESFTACMDSLWETLFSPANTLCLRADREDVFLPLEQICYFEAAGHTVTTHFSAAALWSTRVFRVSIQEIADRLEGRGFLRVQRSFVVNLRYVDRFSNYMVILKNGQRIPVSVKRFSQLRQEFLRWQNG